MMTEIDAKRVAPDTAQPKALHLGPRQWLFRASTLRGVGVAGTLVALVLSLTQTCTLGRQTTLLKDAIGKLPTRRVGEFPENLHEINALLAHQLGNKVELYIVSDVMAYGCFSDVEANQTYENRLRALAQSDAQVRILVYDKPQFISAAADQFGLTLESPITALSDRYKAPLTKFCAANDVPQNDLKTIGDLLEVLWGRNVGFLKDLVQARKDAGLGLGGQIKVTNQPQELFIWSMGGAAVFSLLNQEKEAREISFFTQDPDLVKILRHKATRAWETGTEFTGKDMD